MSGDRPQTNCPEVSAQKSPSTLKAGELLGPVVATWVVAAMLLSLDDNPLLPGPTALPVMMRLAEDIMVRRTELYATAA